MSDGAGYGVTPSRALDTIIGGEPHPDDDELESVGQMRDKILITPIEPGKTYDEACYAYAHAVLELFLSNPKAASLSMDDIYDEVKGNYPNVTSGLTGFQVGWATNAARRCVELEPQENPAIITVRDNSDT